MKGSREKVRKPVWELGKGEDYNHQLPYLLTKQASLPDTRRPGLNCGTLYSVRYAMYELLFTIHHSPFTDYEISRGVFSAFVEKWDGIRTLADARSAALVRLPPAGLKA